MSGRIGIRLALFDMPAPESDDDLAKASAGFSRGGAHKYTRRVRVMVGGKLRWKYYYPDDMTRRREVKRLEKHAERNPKAKEALDDGIHGLMAEFLKDHPIRAHRKELRDLTEEYVQAQLPWSRKPALNIPDDILADYHRSLIDMPEAEDPHGMHMSVLRAVEMAYDRLPPQIKEHFDGAISSLDFVHTADDPLFNQRGWAAYARPRPRDANTQIKVSMEKTFVVPNADHRMGGGMFAMQVVLHEMGHAIHNRLMHGDMQDWPGASWEDYEKWHQKVGRKEPGVTSYAETNEKERWAESFACALMYPKQLADSAPQMYEWMRNNILGEDAMPPLHTDDAKMRKLQAELEKEKKRKPPRPDHIRAIMKAMGKVTGINDMPHDDARLQWWKKPATRVQEVLRQAPPANYATEAVESTFHPSDRFYEMSLGARTVYMRIGPRWDAKTQEWIDPEWSPTGAKGRLLQSNIKEVYDADGKPLQHHAAWWYLHQDVIGDRETVPGAELIGRGDAPLEVGDLVSFRDRVNQKNVALRNTMNMHEVLGKVAKTKGKMAGRPVEMSSREFRLRSGAFAYSAWSEPGADLLDRLKAAQPGTKEHEALLDEYRKKQPNVAFELVRATQWHVDNGLAKNVGQALGRRYITDGGIPRLTSKRFVNENPDGSHTVIEATAGPDGRFYITSPMWRELLTPNGGDIKSAEHLKQLCQQAMEAGLGDPPRPRRAWVSVRADVSGKSDSDHYMHMQVEFDGRGQPRILGSEWKHRIGVDQPRIDDILTSARMSGPETRRPKLKGERIKIAKAKKRKGRGLLPTEPGQRAVLTVTTDELGLKTKGPDREVIVRVDRILPPKKAGEPPPEPGWDRMPEGFDRPLPEGRSAPGVSVELTDAEKKAKDKGLLPHWYEGNNEQRRWFREEYLAAVDQWKKTMKRETAKEYPARYFFIGEARGGAGRKRFIRYGEQEVIDTIGYPEESGKPDPLEHTPLVHLHQQMDPLTGELFSSELRMVLPKDGHIDPEMVENLPGVRVHRAADMAPGVPGMIDHISLDLAAFPRLRETLGGMSLTKDAETMLRHHAEQLREMAERAAEEEHVMPIEDIDPAVLESMGVGVRSKLSNGVEFKLAHHQAALIQKLMDNDGRVLGAHFMGTGKTVSAIVAAKLMMARRNPNHPMHDPNAPKKTLVVAPLNTVEQWRQAAFEFDEGATVVGAKSSDIPVDQYIKMVNEGRDTNDLVIVGPEYFTQNEKALREAGFDALVVDEAHMGIKNAQTARNKAISRWNPDMKMMMLLTGTPITTSPSDILEYIKILSNGAQWAGMTRAQLEEEYLEESPVPGEAGVKGRKGPKVQIKASKRDELAAILARWVHVAMPKDVRGKTLPAVRIEENKHAEMIGIQAQLYAMQLAALPTQARESMSENAALAKDEMAGLDNNARRKVQAAKAIANCPAYKPASDERVLTVMTRTISADGSVSEAAAPFRTFGMDWLKNRPDIRNKKVRKQRKGRWPPVDELTPEIVAVYNTYFKHVIDPKNEGLTYEQVAGQPITKDAWAAMEKAHDIAGVHYEPWGERGVQVQNPDWGPLGIRCRGKSEKRMMTETEAALVDRATNFRRRYQAFLTTPVDQGKGRKPKPPLADEAWEMAKTEFGLTEDEAQHLMGVPPEFYTHSNSITHGGVTVTTDDNWISDTRGSLHLLYHPDDWDFDAGKPRSAGGFEQVRDRDDVEVSGKYKWMERPKGVEEDEWEGPPRLRFREDQGEKSGQRVAVEVMSGPEAGSIKWVRKSEVSARARSLMDPGMRKERAKADVAMVMGNAKAEELMAHIENFHVHTGNGNFAGGEDRGRSMVIFANGILDGCRTVEATLRVQGFRDVNEVLEGSPHYDPDDAGPSPNGKYYVTYIGSTYTGDRELNIEISKKLKDKLGRDTDTSLFVHKTQEGRKWNLWPGGPEHPSIKRSQWTPEQRQRIWQQFKIKAPEAHFVDDQGRQKYFYGTADDIEIPGETEQRKRKGKMVDVPKVVKGSEGVLREMVLTGDPSKMTDPAKRKAAEERLKKLQTLYEGLVRQHAVEQGPMTARQVNVMNNCEVMVLSDAAQVGINKGDAVELVMYDSLASPMAEMQRITRSARMLPPAVRDELMNKHISAVKGIDGAEFSYAQLSLNPDHPRYIEGAQRVDHLWQEMERTGNRPEGMSWVEYKRRAEANGAKAGSEEAFNARPMMGGDEKRDADRITWEKDGKVAVTYLDGDGAQQLAWVDRKNISEADGAFRRIRDRMEAAAFDPSWAGAPPPGKAIGVSLAGGPAEDLNFGEILAQVAALAGEQAERSKSDVQREDWSAIAARARAASTLGVVSAAAALNEFKGMKVPGGTGNLIDFKGLKYQDPTEGTYAIRTAAERASGVKATPMEQAINEPINAIREVIERELSDEDRRRIAKAGFVEQGESGSLDATEIYLAMRAQQIMDGIDRRRPEVARRMRSEAGGKIVTEADIMNTIIDELSPMDRAILKSKKYLVNVRRIGVSAHVPQQVKARTLRRDEEGNVMTDDKGNPRETTTRVFGGFEKEHPVATERNTRAIGRARLIPVEDLLFTIQQGVQVRHDMDFVETTARDVANASRLDPIQKSLIRLVFGLEN